MTSTASAPALDETAIEINRMRREWDELSRERDSYVARIEAMHSETAADRIKCGLAIWWLSLRKVVASPSPPLPQVSKRIDRQLAEAHARRRRALPRPASIASRGAADGARGGGKQGGGGGSGAQAARGDGATAVQAQQGGPRRGAEAAAALAGAL